MATLFHIPVLRHAGVLLASILLAMSAGTASAQETSPDDTTGRRPVQLEANTLTGTVEDGESIRRLVGNVRLQQGETRLWARRATHYPGRDEIFFRGNVLIVERGDSLSADTVLYNSQRKVGQASGNVRLTDGDVVVQAPSGTYYAEDKVTQFDEGLRLIDSVTVVTSQAGTYYSETRLADLYGDVALDHPDARLVADSLSYHRDNDVSEAYGNVFIERWEEDDRAEDGARTLIYGGQAYNDEQSGYSRVEERPVLMHLQPDSSTVDTLIIRARQLEAIRGDSLHRLTAVDSVRIWQSHLAAVADSAVYDRYTIEGDSTREEARLFRSPMAWFEQTQVNGDSLFTHGRSGSIDTLLVYGNAFAAQRDTTLDRIQQLRGRHLLGLFEDNDLRQLHVGPNAESAYFLRDDSDQLAGAVRVSGDSIAFSFHNEALERIRVLSGVQGTQYQPENIPSPLQLPSYRWNPESRPSRPELLAPLPATPPAPAPPPSLPPENDELLLPEPAARRMTNRNS